MSSPDINHSQPSFWFRPENYGGVEIKVGSKAVEVVDRILQLNPDVLRVSLAYYDINSTYKDSNSVFSWYARSLITPSNLQQHSDQVFGSTQIWCETEPGEKSLVSAKAIAVASKVIIWGGGVMHIPMLDFSDENKILKVKISDIEQVTGSRRGCITKTDNSHHFWGYGLLTENEWLNWMREVFCKNMQFVDEEFIEASLNRGYSALRLFDYPPFKNVAPEVVSINGGQ